MLLVNGTIVFDTDAEPPVGATVYVRLEDVSRADAAATVAAEKVISNVRVSGEVPSVAFSLHGADLDPRHHYSLRVHVDVDGDGEVGVGDYVSTASCPVQAGSPGTVSIAVRRVT